MGELADISILKPRNDTRQYRRIVLPNGLQALLVSDPDTDKVAASMDVYAGYFSDPDGLEGLAHFLEHMLFFSSAKYPLEDSYMKYLSEHGGHSNAYTSPEHTNFYFDVNADHLTEALDRFAQFFICPLMSADATSREMKAVDSENTKNLTVDAWRFDQLWKHNSSSSHPYNKFGTGSIETLDLRPKAKGIDTREELLKFYDGHYSSNIMCLAVYGKETLDNLQNLVESMFSEIKNTQKEYPSFPGHPCQQPENLQILMKAVPIKDEHSLMLNWLITPELLCYKEGPSQYIAHLIGHEAEGSLFALLKSLGWATSLYAGESDGSIKYAFFRVNIELTDLGQDHLEEVIGLVFQYIKILKEEGVQDWIFQEVKAVREMNFHFKDKNAPADYVSRLSRNMQLYPPHDWLAGASLPCNFSADTIMTTLKMLTPETVRILSASRLHEGKTTDFEPWYGTSFSVERIAEELIEKWKTSPIDCKLHLPSANPFIPTDFSLKAHDAKIKHPSLLIKSSMSKLWYKPDNTFSTPKACIQIHFNLPQSYVSPEAVVLSTLFVKLLLDYLNENAYYAEVAGLNYNIVQTALGFQVLISGYNHKIAALLEKIIEKIVNFKVVEARFSVVKEKVLKDYLNFRFQQPYQQALYYTSLLLQHKKWDIDSYIEAITPIEALDLNAFFPRLLSRVYVESYVAGNMIKDDAKSLSVMIERSLREGHAFKSKSIFESQHSERRIVQLKREANLYYSVAALNLADANSSLHLYLQVTQDEELVNVLLELFILSAKQEVFYQLRSVQQLGYIVVLANRDDCGVRGAQFIIQSTLMDPRDLDARVEEFLSSFEDKLANLTEEEFKTHVNALIEIKLEKHKNLYEETRFFWGEIDDGTLKFSRQQDEAAALRTLQKEDLLGFFAKYIKPGAPNRAKLSIHVYGGAHEKEYGCLEGGDKDEADKDDGSSEAAGELQEKEGAAAAPHRIRNVFEFKRSQSLFSSLK